MIKEKKKNVPYQANVAGYNGKIAGQKYALQNYLKDHLKGIRYLSGYNFVSPSVRWLYMPCFLLFVDSQLYHHPCNSPCQQNHPRGLFIQFLIL
jgi:hypothetical protein